MTHIEPVLQRKAWKKVVILTGAGVSVASGLRPFRGPGGLWEEKPEIANLMKAGVPVETLWQLTMPMRTEILQAKPNAAHVSLATFANHLETLGGACYLITQNIDGLHTKAGFRNVIELHGSLLRTRCSSCDLAPFDDRSTPEYPGRCSRCSAALRPDIVLFDEPLPAYEEMASKRALRDSDLFISIGTSGTVWPAANFVRSAEYEGAHTIFANLTEMSPPNPAFREIILGKAELILPQLLAIGDN